METLTEIYVTRSGPGAIRFLHNRVKQTCPGRTPLEKERANKTGVRSVQIDKASGEFGFVPAAGKFSPADLSRGGPGAQCMLGCGSGLSWRRAL